MILFRSLERSTVLKFSLLIAFCLGGSCAHAQAPSKKLKEFSTAEVDKVSIDRLGNLYLVLVDGVIRKYDTEGNFTDEFPNPDKLPITLVEPWNPLRVFVYIHRDQKIVLLDHHLSFLKNLTIDPAHAVEPLLVCPSVNNFWIFDGADHSLKKIDSKTSAVIEEVVIKSIDGPDHDFSFLREYQNQLFLIDRKTGIQILSNLGKSIHTFPAKEATYIGFLGQEIYYLQNGKVHFYDLYSEDTRELTVDPTARFVLLTDERMILVKKGMVEVWEYKP